MGDEPCHPAREWKAIAVPILFVHNFSDLSHVFLQGRVVTISPIDGTMDFIPFNIHFIFLYDAV
eukprot:4997390-Ditylum_brightwellii.AAC.1